MMDRNETVNKAIQFWRDQRRELGEDTLAADVAECFNCREVKIGEDSAWIADPRGGYWLSDDQLVHFMEWQQARS